MDVRGALGRALDGIAITTSKDFCQALLEKYFVATVPGEEFGNPGYMRLSFATSTAKMSEAISRMKTMIGAMK